MELYKSVVADFRSLTAITSPVSERCCLRVIDGSPYCSYSVAMGEYVLYFTPREIDILGGVSVIEAQGMQVDLMGDYYIAKSIDPVLVGESLHTGLLSETLESASHPTRPVIRNGELYAVATVQDCIAEYNREALRLNRAKFHEAWLKALKFGTKPYYLTGDYDPNKYIVL